MSIHFYRHLKIQNPSIISRFIPVCKIGDLRMHARTYAHTKPLLIYEKVRAAYGRPPSRSCGGLRGPSGPLGPSGPAGGLRPPLPLPPQKNLKKKIQDGRHGPKMAASNRYGSN